MSLVQPMKGETKVIVPIGIIGCHRGRDSKMVHVVGFGCGRYLPYCTDSATVRLRTRQKGQLQSMAKLHRTVKLAAFR